MIERRGQVKPLLLIAILLLAAAGTIWFWLRPGNQPSQETGRKVAEAFLQQLQNAQPELAWQSTTSEFKSARGKEAFIRDVAPLQFLREGLWLESVESVTVGPQTRSEYSFRSKSGETVRIVVAREEGKWKVDRWLPAATIKQGH